jgi:hypothetical protein
MKRLVIAAACAAALLYAGGTLALAAGKPTATTGNATSVTNNSATVNATVNPNGEPTNYAFQYGTTNKYGQQTQGAAVPGGAATSPQPVSASISNLTQGTVYHYRVIASNASGTVVGGDRTFTTTGSPPAPVQPPTVTTKPATKTSTSGATLNGTVNPNGSPVKVYFEYGLSSFYGVQTSAKSIAGDRNVHNVSSTLTGLAANQTYHYRLDAQDARGRTIVGRDMTFRTSAAGAAPALRLLHIRPPAFRVPAGTTISYRDSQSATTTFTIQRIVDGRVSGGRCVATRPSNAHNRHCTRFVFVGRFTRRDHRGANRFHFSGVVNGHRLRAGRYRLTAQAHNGNGTSPRKRARFRVNH